MMPSALSLLERNPPTPADLARMIDGYRVDQRPPPEPLLGPDVPTHAPEVFMLEMEASYPVMCSEASGVAGALRSGAPDVAAKLKEWGLR